MFKFEVYRKQYYSILVFKHYNNINEYKVELKARK